MLSHASKLAGAFQWELASTCALAYSDWHPRQSAMHDKTNQKSPKVSLSQDKSAFTPSGGRGVKWRFLLTNEIPPDRRELGAILTRLLTNLIFLRRQF